jgi:hypothetical protein
MTCESFAYWLQGYFELSDSDSLTVEQVKMIKKHLDLVFTNVTNDNNIFAPDNNQYCYNAPKYDVGELLC